MPADYVYIADAAEHIESPQDGILSKTYYEDEWIKIVLFGFSKGQELSEHTASKPATLFVKEGEATIRLGKDEIHARGGSWIYMPPQMAHAIRAETPVTMLLALHKA